MKIEVFILGAIGLGMVSSFLYEADVENQAPIVVATLPDPSTPEELAEDLINPDPARILEESNIPAMASAAAGEGPATNSPKLNTEDQKAIETAFSLVEESLNITEISADASSLMRFLDNKNMNPVQNLEGTEEYGERYEIAADSDTADASRVEANFNIMQDGSEEMQSIRSFSLIRDEQAFETLFKKMNQKLAENPNAELIEMTESTRRWLLPEGLAVWMKQRGEKDGKFELAVATEYLP